MSAIASIDQTYSAPTNTTSATQIVNGSIALAANYGSSGTHGDTLNFGLYGIQSATLVRCIVYEQPAAGTAPTGYQWGFAKGSTINNGLLTCMSAVATEYGNGSAYSAPQLAAVLRFEATFEVGK